MMEREDVISSGNNFGEPGTTDVRIDSNLNEMDYTFHSTGSELHNKKYLHTSFGDTFFFSHWTTTTHVHTLVSCVVLLFLAIVHEVLKTICSERKGLGSWNSSSADVSKAKEADSAGDKVWFRRYVSTTTLANGFFTGSQIALFYLLVMAVMTMNVWVYLSIVIGSVIGRFIPLSRLLPALSPKIETHDEDEPGVTKTA